MPTAPDHIRGLGKIHHVALIVRSLEEALGFWRDLLGLDLETIMDIEHDRVRIAFLGVGESKVELVQPTDDSTGVQAFRFIKRTYASSRGVELSLEKRLTRRLGLEV